MGIVKQLQLERVDREEFTIRYHEELSELDAVIVPRLALVRLEKAYDAGEVGVLKRMVKELLEDLV